MWLPRLSLLGLCVVGGGCDVFDPSLYQSAAGLTLADRCESTASLPQVLPDSSRIQVVDTTRLGDQYREFAGCVGNDLPGNEGFFSVNMRRGETWHFHVDPLDPVDGDPAVYVLPVCTTLQCSPAAASDVCGPGRGEHFSFRPESDGAYVVGIDSRTRGGARYGVTVVNPICGNGILEHGEPCDDGRPQGGVVCERCHKVLQRPLESEVGVANDDYTNSMALRPEAGFATPYTVAGSLAVCDADMFDFDVAAGRRVVLTLRAAAAGAPCPEGVSLGLVRSDRPVGDALTTVPATVSEAVVERRDNCPVVVLAQAPRDGVYFARVTVAQQAITTDFAYQLSVQVTDPM